MVSSLSCAKQAYSVFTFFFRLTNWHFVGKYISNSTCPQENFGFCKILLDWKLIPQGWGNALVFLPMASKSHDVLTHWASNTFAHWNNIQPPTVYSLLGYKQELFSVPFVCKFCLVITGHWPFTGGDKSERKVEWVEFPLGGEISEATTLLGEWTVWTFSSPGSICCWFQPGACCLEIWSPYPRPPTSARFLTFFLGPGCSMQTRLSWTSPAHTALPLAFTHPFLHPPSPSLPGHLEDVGTESSALTTVIKVTVGCHGSSGNTQRRNSTAR